MRASWILLAVAVLTVPGCLSDDPVEPASTPSPSSGVVIDQTRPDTAFGTITTGPVAAPDVNATLAAAPLLIPGEWWRLRFDTPLAGDVVEVVRVVAAVEPEGYLIGMPHEGWYKEAIAYHAPAFGDVGLDLSYATHNEIFQPVQFPLVVGNTWETEFATMPVIAKVESIDGLRATITMTTPESAPEPTDPLYAALGLSQSGESMRLIYDASVHEIVYFESSIGSWEVVEHGYGFEGWITIPRGEHTAIDYGNFGPATPGQPIVTREIPIDGSFNRMTLMHLVFPLGPGAYRIRSVGPDGTEFLTESTGADFVIKFYEATSPDGKWATEDIVAGPGATYSMGIAYHQYDIRLPDGARRSDHSHEVIR